jgi:hypothetical protein
MKNLLRLANLIFFFLLCLTSSAQTNYEDYLSSETIFTDDFSNNNNKWVTGWSSDSCYTSKIENGAYEIKSSCVGTYPAYWLTRTIDITRDFEIEGRILYVQGESNNALSLLWGKSDSFHSLYFGISGNGQFRISQFNGSWTNIKDWTASDLVYKTDYNKLTVRKIDSKYYFFLNEKLVHISDFYTFFGNQIGFQDNQNTTMRVNYLNISYLKPNPGLSKTNSVPVNAVSANVVTKNEGSSKKAPVGPTEGGFIGVSGDYLIFKGDFDGESFFSVDDEIILVPKLKPNAGFGIQAGALYRNLGFDFAYHFSRTDYTTQLDGFSGKGTTHLIRWFGVKCYFNTSTENRIKPYIDIDLSFTISHFEKLTYLSNNTSDFRSANYTGLIMGAGIGTLVKLSKNLALDLKVLPEYYSGGKIKSKGEKDHSIKKFNNFMLMSSFGLNYYFNKKR